MRVVMQRVSSAQVTVEGQVVGSVGPGAMILVGVRAEDTAADADALARKVWQLRIFEDAEGKMNRSLEETGGAALVVSQFTLYADTRKGRRPSWNRAAPPELARALYEHFCAALRGLGCPVETGIFQAKMQVSLCNEGPVTLLVDSEREL